MRVRLQERYTEKGGCSGYKGMMCSQIRCYQRSRPYLSWNQIMFMVILKKLNIYFVHCINDTLIGCGQIEFYEKR